MKTLIYGGSVVTDGQQFTGYLIVNNGDILCVEPGNPKPGGNYDEVIDASGCVVMPGVIDSHVHFREPGLTAKADIASESRAAAWGGVTTYFDMPNTVPQTVTLEALADKWERGARESLVNYAFFYGATNDNAHTFAEIDRHLVPGIKLFMGSSTGNMLVEGHHALYEVFAEAQHQQLPVVAHCEDTATINQNMARAKQIYGPDPDVSQHWRIRSAEACYICSSIASQIAAQTGAHLHIAHVSTARELELAAPNVTLEACVPHLTFTNEDYAKRGSLIKCNPAIKTAADRAALRRALTDGRISTVATDHAPHQLSEKVGGAARAKSGMPFVQYSLVQMLELVDQRVLTLPRLVKLMCHAPAEVFGVSRRGFLRPGYRADIVIVKPNTPFTVSTGNVQSKCKWSPVMGHTYHWQVMRTLCNGVTVYHKGHTNTEYRGEQVLFRQ